MFHAHVPLPHTVHAPIQYHAPVHALLGNPVRDPHPLPPPFNLPPMPPHDYYALARQHVAHPAFGATLQHRAPYTGPFTHASAPTTHQHA